MTKRSKRTEGYAIELEEGSAIPEAEFRELLDRVAANIGLDRMFAQGPELPLYDHNQHQVGVARRNG
jgi:hypothetical protein